MTATKNENPNLPTSSAPDKQPILAQVTTRTRNRKRKKEETDDEDEKKKEEIKRKKEIKDDEEIEKENDDGNKADNAEEQPSFKAQFEKREKHQSYIQHRGQNIYVEAYQFITL